MTNPIIEGDPYGTVKEEKHNPSPSPSDVNLIHVRDDTDSSQVAHHHTIGISHNQASAGDHTHNGRNARPVGQGEGWSITITGLTPDSKIDQILTLLHRFVDFTQS